MPQFVEFIVLQSTQACSGDALVPAACLVNCVHDGATIVRTQEKGGS